MNRRTALSVVASLVGMVGHADTIQARTAEEYQKIPPHDTAIRFRDEISDKEVALIKRSGEMILTLTDIATITVQYQGQTKTISPKELFEAL